MDEKIRLGGMALVNGVLVHGPNSWGCAIRTPEGELRVASDYKRLRAAGVRNPLLRGPARMAEVFALLPQVRRAAARGAASIPAPAGAGGDAGHARSSFGRSGTLGA